MFIKFRPVSYSLVQGTSDRLIQRSVSLNIPEGKFWKSNTSKLIKSRRNNRWDGEFWARVPTRMDSIFLVDPTIQNIIHASGWNIDKFMIQVILTENLHLLWGLGYFWTTASTIWSQGRSKIVRFFSNLTIFDFKRNGNIQSKIPNYSWGSFLPLEIHQRGNWFYPIKIQQ